MAVIPSPVPVGVVEDVGIEIDLGGVNSGTLLGDIIDGGGVVPGVGYGLSFINPTTGTSSWTITIAGGSSSLVANGVQFLN